MLEKDIENLIALYPEEFFPGKGFQLIGRQIRTGKYYVDLLFKDKYDTTIIIEIQKDRLDREHVGQIVDYYGCLKNAYSDRYIELILCANIIPTERRLYLENAGIECKEIPVGSIKNIAKKYGYQFSDEKHETNNNESSMASTERPQNMSKLSIPQRALVTAKKYFLDKRFTREQLYDAMVQDFGSINPTSYLPADWSANHLTGHSFSKKTNKWTKIHKLFFKHDDGKFELYNPDIHGNWTREGDTCRRID